MALEDMFTLATGGELTSMFVSGSVVHGTPLYSNDPQ